MSDTKPLTAGLISTADAYSAHNYHPLPVVVAEAAGSWMTDVDGKRYLDLLAGYSALNFGHRHPRLIAAAKAQLDRVTLTSRAFHNDQFAAFCKQLAELCGMEEASNRSRSSPMIGAADKRTPNCWVSGAGRRSVQCRG